MKKKCMPENGYQTCSPEQMMRGDTTTKPGPGTAVPDGVSTEPGNPAGYPTDSDPGSEGY